MSKYKNKNDTVEYWIERAGDIKNKNLTSVDEIMRELDSVYEEIAYEMENSIMSFISKYAHENGLSYAEAQKTLTKIEISEFKGKMRRQKNKVKRYEETLGSHSDYVKSLKAKVNELSARNEYTRLQTLYDELELHRANLEIETTTMTEKFLVNHYIDNLTSQEDIIKSGLGIEKSFRTPSFEAVLPIIQYPHSGSMFSETIWKATDKLVNGLKQTLTFGMVQGHSIDKMVKNLKSNLKTHARNEYKNFDIRRIVRTESAFIQERAKQDANLKYGIENYMVISANDKRSCPKCKKQHHMIYDESSRVNGLNAPPFHPQCRCTTAPYVDDAVLDALDEDAEKMLKEAKERKQERMGGKEKVNFDRVEKEYKRLGIDNLAPSDYLDDAKRKLENAPQFIKDVWNEYEHLIEYETIDCDGTSYYDNSGRKLHMNTRRELEGQKTMHNTFFHEIAHLFDLKANGHGARGFSTMYNNGEFEKTLRKEAKKYVDGLCKEAGVKGYSDRQWTVYKDLSSIPSKSESDISDIIDGATNGRYQGQWGHSKSYWEDKNNCPIEAFAEMFSATIVDPVSLEEIKKRLPKSYEVFKKICESMVE